MDGGVFFNNHSAVGLRGKPLYRTALQMEDDVQASSLPEVNSRQLRAVLARLPPRVFDGEALLGPRMKDARPGEKVIRQLRDPSPGRAVLLTASGARGR